MAHTHLAFDMASESCGCHNPRPDARIKLVTTDAATALLASADIIREQAATIGQRDAEIAHLRGAFNAHRELIHSTAPDDAVFDSVERLNAAFGVTA